MKSARNKIVKASLLLLGLQILAQLAGLGKQMLVAAQFGTSEVMDAYFVALTAVGLIKLWVELPLKQILIPMFRHDLAQRGERVAWANVSVLLNDLVIGLSLAALAGWLLAPFLVTLLAPGFDKGAEGIAVSLTQITMVSVVFIGIGTVLSQLFFSYERFFIPGFVETVEHVVIIAVFLALGGTYGIYGLGVAVVFGAIALCVVQLPILWEKRTFYSPKVDFRHPGVREVGKLGLPLLLAEGSIEIARISDRIFASLLPAGRLTALALGHRLISIPLDFLTKPLHRAMIPHFAKLTAERDFPTLSRQLFRYLRVSFFVNIPVAMGIMAVAEGIVRIVFQRGAFDETSVRITSQALFFYAIGLPALPMCRMLNRVFVNLKDTWTPSKMALYRVGVKVVLSFVLIPPLGHMGIALAESLSQIARAVFLLFLLPEELKGQEGWQTLKSFAQTLAACVVMGVVVTAVKGEISGLFSVPLEMTAMVLLGAAVYGVIALCFQREEGHFVLQALTELRMKNSVQP